MNGIVDTAPDKCQNELVNHLLLRTIILTSLCGSFMRYKIYIVYMYMYAIVYDLKPSLKNQHIW